MAFVKIILLPLSIIYGVVTGVRIPYDIAFN